MESAIGFTLGFIGIILFLTVGSVVFTIATSVWAYKDSIKKGRSTEYALFALVGTLFFPIIGIIVYLIFRKQ